MRWVAMMIAAAALPGAAPAEDSPSPRIVVTGTATVTTAPDRATIDYRIVGEGATSDAAVAAMVAVRTRIASRTGALDATTGQLSVAALRGADCRDTDDDDRGPRLSSGKCAVIGYVATMAVTTHSGAAAEAGTLIGLLGHLGAQNPRLEGFTLADPAAAERRAVAAALVDARRQAEAIAAGTGVRLGRVLIASTGQRGEELDIIVTGTRMRTLPAPPPIVVPLTPQPIDTRAQVTVTYAIAP